MPLPVLTPGRRRGRRWPYLATAPIVGAAVFLGARQAWPHADRATNPPAGSATLTHAAEPPHARAVARSVSSSHRVNALLDKAGARHSHRFVPRLGARAAILVNESTGRVLWAYNPYRRLPIASTTKIMTALLVLEHLPATRVVTITRIVPRVPLVREGLRAGERVPVRKLLFGLMLFSGNDDALALAQAAGGSRRGFLRLMNQRAAALGLHGTHFTSPSGVIDRGNFSTAWDMAALTRYARRDARFRRLVRTRIKRVAWPAPTFSKVYVNKNALLATFPGADGVKTGWTTKARHCIVASAHRRGVRLIAVVLGSRDAFADAGRLLSYGFRLGGR